MINKTIPATFIVHKTMFLWVFLTPLFSVAFVTSGLLYRQQFAEIKDLFSYTGYSKLGGLLVVLDVSGELKIWFSNCGSYL